jgi:hypothetical protein
VLGLGILWTTCRLKICQSQIVTSFRWEPSCSGSLMVSIFLIWPTSLFPLPAAPPLHLSPLLTSHLRPPVRCSTSRTSQLEVGKAPCFPFAAQQSTRPVLGTWCLVLYPAHWTVIVSPLSSPGSYIPASFPFLLPLPLWGQTGSTFGVFIASFRPGMAILQQQAAISIGH